MSTTDHQGADDEARADLAKDLRDASDDARDEPTPILPKCQECQQRRVVSAVWDRQRGYQSLCADCAKGY